MKIKQFFALVLVCCSAAFTASAEEKVNLATEKHGWYGHCQNAAFQSFSGHSELCLTRRGISGRLKVTDLVPGDAYTVWWIYFDDPSKCQTPFQCSDVDFEPGMPDADPVAVFGRMDSGIAPRKGRLRFGDFLNGMQPTSGSQVWFLIFGHGEAAYDDGRALARQLLTPEDPLAGAPHLGIQGNPAGFPVGVAVFAIE